jgi:hypothetical protein
MNSNKRSAPFAACLLAATVSSEAVGEGAMDPTAETAGERQGFKQESP